MAYNEPQDHADLLALKNELAHDPRQLGLTTSSQDDEANANTLNLFRANISVMRRSVSTQSVFDSLDPLEHQAMGPSQARYLTDFLNFGQFDPFSSPGIVAGLAQIFHPTLSVSGPKITELIHEHGSRITELYQLGLLSKFENVTPSDIARARVA